MPKGPTLALALALSGCAWQSGALQLGENTWQTSATATPARGGSTGARRIALQAANKKCEALGKTIEVTDIKTGYAFPANSTAAVTFKCK